MTEHDNILAVQQSLTNDFEIEACATGEALFRRLAARINHLIQADFHKLVAILYRLDVSEGKLRQTLQENTSRDAGELIASLVIERELQKHKTRQQFRTDRDIPEDEKW